MSTKAIRKLIAWAQAQDADTEAFDGATVGSPCAEAMAEVEAIEKACRVLEAEGVGDHVYRVRDHAASDAAFTGNTWEHPRVVAYGEAAQVVTNIAKETA
jgi:predicted outer membrane protein